MYRSSLDPYKAKEGKTDPIELDNRIYNLKYCVENYFNMHTNIYELEKEAKRFDINRVCKTEVVALKNFANQTGLRYENVYIDPDTIKYDIN